MSDNQWLKDGLSWFLQFIPQTEWETRKTEILNYLDEALWKPDGRTRRISYDTDVFAWYLVLVDLYLNQSTKYDFFQGSRVIPYILTIGKNAHQLDTITGIEERASRIVKCKV